MVLVLTFSLDLFLLKDVYIFDDSLNIILKTISDCAHAFALNSYSGKLFWLEAFFICMCGQIQREKELKICFVFYLSQDIASYKSTLFFFFEPPPPPLAHGLHMKSGKHYWNNFEGKMVFWALVVKGAGVGAAPSFYSQQTCIYKKVNYHAPPPNFLESMLKVEEKRRTLEGKLNNRYTTPPQRIRICMVIMGSFLKKILFLLVKNF